VEFALIAPVLVGLLVPIADFGLYIYDQMQLKFAVQGGAQYAAANGYNVSGIQTAAAAAAPSLNLPQNNISVSEFCGCPDANNNIVVTPNCTGATKPRPNCNNDPTQPTVGVYVQIVATYNFNTLFHYPAIPDSMTLSSGQDQAFRFQ
jgi:Flp pilus assembly protein TadG